MESTKWMITIAEPHSDGSQTLCTVAIETHPADWLAKYGTTRLGRTKHIAFAMPISEEQYEALGEAGYE